MWLTDRKSPLTARVAVNRVWQAMFGEGLVETAEDFGTRSPMPEYRELLDWLAVDYMEHNWSQKHLIRTIVNSRVWKQNSRTNPELIERDPRNRLLARGAKIPSRRRSRSGYCSFSSRPDDTQVRWSRRDPSRPQNVLDYNYVYPSYWKPAKDRNDIVEPFWVQKAVHAGSGHDLVRTRPTETSHVLVVSVPTLHWPHWRGSMRRSSWKLLGAGTASPA